MKILKKGILSSFQDLGRQGYKASGLNSGGAMDSFSLKLLNLILLNCLKECAIELHFPGPLIQFEEDCIFAISGADFGAKLNGEEVILNRQVCAKPGDLLSFKLKKFGERAYFGVKGGFETPIWLNSKATQTQLNHLNIEENQTFRVNSKSGDQLIRLRGISRRGLNANKNAIRFVPSFEFQKLSPISKMKISESEFEIGMDSSRMGYKLEGPNLYLEKKEEMISSAVEKGIIQILPNGQLAILMADAQVTGGYPKLGFIIENDISKLSQMGPKSKIKFVEVSMNFAIENIQKTELLFQKMRKSIAYASVKN